MKKIVVGFCAMLLLGSGMTFADATLQQRAVLLVDMLAQHKKLEPSDALPYRSNREKMIAVAMTKRSDLSILPFLYDAVVAKKSSYTDYNNWQLDKNELLGLVNKLRTGLGLTGLAYHPELDLLAQQYAQYIYTTNHFSHTSLSGETLADRAKTINYPYTLIGENLARGYTLPVELLSGWYQSPTHRANLLDAGFVHMGLGRAGDYRVQLFGRPE